MSVLGNIWRCRGAIWYAALFAVVVASIVVRGPDVISVVGAALLGPLACVDIIRARRGEGTYILIPPRT